MYQNPYTQDNWRWCSNCQGLFFAGHSLGACPKGGNHTYAGSGDYVLTANRTDEKTQDDWHWCRKCQGLFWAGQGLVGNFRPAGQTHDQSESGNYVLSFGKYQTGWRWCSSCQALWYTGTGSTGKCPETRAGHNGLYSGDYGLPATDPASGDPGQHKWRWCVQCQGLYFFGYSAGVCPAGGGHANPGSSNYALLQYVSDANTQQNWRYCKKCEGLFFATGSTTGICPKGNGHDPSSSGNYVLPFQGGQDQWRRCRKCQGLFFSAQSFGLCPGGLTHDPTGSGNYRLTQEVPSADLQIGPPQFEGKPVDHVTVPKYQPVTISWNVTNAGGTATGSFSDRCYVKDPGGTTIRDNSITRYFKVA